MNINRIFRILKDAFHGDKLTNHQKAMRKITKDKATLKRRARNKAARAMRAKQRRKG
jgi:hypothetical protein